MQLTMMSDILLRDAADPGKVKRALAHGFDLPVSAVYLRTMGDLDAVPTRVSVQLTHEPQSLPGDFAAWYHLSLDPVLHSRLDRVLAHLARDLQTVVGTDDDGMVLYLPDGSRHQVQVQEDDDGAIEFSNAVQTLIRSHSARTAASS